eukprot:s5442_g2.t2
MVQGTLQKDIEPHRLTEPVFISDAMVTAQRRLCALLGHVEASMVPCSAPLERRTVAADPVVADVEAVKRAVEHCNADHADAVLEMSRAFTGLSGIQKAVMLSIDQYGFDVLCETQAGPVQSREDVFSVASERMEEEEQAHHRSEDRTATWQGAAHRKVEPFSSGF